MVKSPLGWVENPSPEMRLHYPGAWYNDDRETNQNRAELLDSLENADIVAISDTDVDGLSSIALVELAFPNKRVARVPSGHSQAAVETTKALELTNEHATDQAEVFVMDIRPDETESNAIATELRKRTGTTYLFDHHQWDDDMYSEFNDIVDVFDVRENGDYCAAGIAYDVLEDNYSDVESIRELTNIVQDHDLWIKEDKRSDRLSDFHNYCDSHDRFVETVKQYGGDILSTAPTELKRELETREREKNELIEAGAKESEWVRIIITTDGDVTLVEDKLSDPSGEEQIQQDNIEEEITVAITYGSAYPSGLGDVLCRGWKAWYRVSDDEDWSYEDRFPNKEWNSDWYRAGDADIVAIIPPWDKVSFRGTQEYPFCDIIAERLGQYGGGGGGHTVAAGCNPMLVGSRNNISAGEHWESKGSIVKRYVRMILDGTFSEIYGTEVWEERRSGN